MDARDAHVRHVAVFGRGDVALALARLQTIKVDALFRAGAVNLKVEVAAHAERHGALRGLEVLRHIGIHIVLAVEHRMLLDIAVGGQTGEHNALDSGLVRHGKRARQAQANGTRMRIGVGAEFELATAEHLRVQRGELSMDFQADDGFPILQNLFELLHAIHRPFQPQNRARWALRHTRLQAPPQRGTCSRL